MTTRAWTTAPGIGGEDELCADIAEDLAPRATVRILERAAVDVDVLAGPRELEGTPADLGRLLLVGEKFNAALLIFGAKGKPADVARIHFDLGNVYRYMNGRQRSLDGYQPVIVQFRLRGVAPGQQVLSAPKTLSGSVPRSSPPVVVAPVLGEEHATRAPAIQHAVLLLLLRGLALESPWG